MGDKENRKYLIGKIVTTVLGLIAAIAAVAGAIYAIVRFFSAEYYEGYDEEEEDAVEAADEERYHVLGDVSEMGTASPEDAKEMAKEPSDEDPLAAITLTPEQ